MMLFSNRCGLIAAAVFCLSAAWAVENANDPVFDVPRLGSIAIDGNLSDWNGAGLKILTLTSPKGAPWPKSTPPPTACLGWNESGLLVGVTVHQREPNEHDYVRHLFKGDSIEVFCAPRKGSRDRYMLVVSPGLDPKYPQPRNCFFADPADEAERDLSSLSFQFGRKKTEDGYTAELLLPWSNLNVTPKPGLETALQIYVMESDDGEKSTTAMWHPAGESHVDPYAVHRIRLVERSEAKPVTLSASAQDDLQHNARIVRIVGSTEQIGKRYEVHSDSGTLIGALLARGSQAYAALDLENRQSCTVSVNKLPVPVVVLPAEATLPVVMANLECRFKQCVFAGETFPEPYLENARNYRIERTTYYDAAFNAVTAAGQPGRYAAVVQIVSANGKIHTRRFRTLFRVPEKLGSWVLADKLEELPKKLAVFPVALAALRQTQTCYPASVAKFLDARWLQSDGALGYPDLAALCASLHDRERGVPVVDTDFRWADRQWWVDFKRTLYGTGKRFAQPFAPPAHFDGPAATVLREGTEQDAGVRAGTVAKLDAICKAGAAESNEPVAICLARHGVVFFQRAYGEIDGRPMTMDRPCPMESTSKILAGALMLVAVDRKLAGLDEPIERFLPPFKGLALKTPLTIRHLYTHYNGLSGIWGDEIHDTEETVASMAPALDIGNFSYNSIGFALGGKILEQLSGEAYPLLARKVLLEPLGMTHTTALCGAHGVISTAGDYARFGQMLLDRGAYGNTRFFSSETFEKMLPIPGAWSGRGIGVYGISGNGFGAGTFGHGANHSGTLRVDPVHDLVVSVTSMGTRKGSTACWPLFFTTLTQGLDDSADPTVPPPGPNAQDVKK